MTLLRHPKEQKQADSERSELEAIFALQLRSQGAHFPVAQREYRGVPGRRFRFDFAWVDQKVAVEIEGAIHNRKCRSCGQMLAGGRHTRAEGFENDCEKYALAALEGWLVLRVTKNQIEDQTALRWLERALFPIEKGRSTKP